MADVSYTAHSLYLPASMLTMLELRTTMPSPSQFRASRSLAVTFCFKRDGEVSHTVGRKRKRVHDGSTHLSLPRSFLAGGARR